MALIAWSDDYRIGIDAVDHEHRQLVALINRLHESLLAGEAGSVAAFFGDLNKAISSHFALEERFMREQGYDQLAEHKAAHESLLDEIRAIMENYEADPRASAGLLADQLDAWFSVHFKTHDARLHHRLGAHDHA